MKKKVVSILLTMSLGLAMTACGSGEVESELVESEAEAEAEKADEMSQSEWMEANGGYEKVECINVDTDEITLKYTGYEIVDGIDDNEEPIKEVVVYFDYTNKTQIDERIHEAVLVEAYQGGIGLINWLTDIEGNESVENSYTYIMDGATLNVGIVFELENVEDPVRIRVGNSYSGIYTENSAVFACEQEISLK